MVYRVTPPCMVSRPCLITIRGAFFNFKRNELMTTNLLKAAVEKWGKETQIHKLQEELLELALVLNQANCPTKDKEETEARIYDELADVKIMMMQAELYLFDRDRINERVKFKLNRMAEKYFPELTGWIDKENDSPYNVLRFYNFT